MKDLSSFRNTFNPERSKIQTQRKHNNLDKIGNPLPDKQNILAKKTSRNVIKKCTAKSEFRELNQTCNGSTKERTSTKDETNPTVRTKEEITEGIDRKTNYGSLYEFIDDSSFIDVGLSTTKNASLILPSNFLKVDLIERIKKNQNFHQRKDCLKERYGRHYQNVVNQSTKIDFSNDHVYKNIRRKSVDYSALNHFKAPDLTQTQISMLSTMTATANKLVRFQSKNEGNGETNTLNFLQTPSKRRHQAKAVVKSFRDKNDPYMRITSRYELTKDADDRDVVNYEAFIGKMNKNHILNSIKRCKLDSDRIKVPMEDGAEEEDEEQQSGAFKLKRKYHEKDQFTRINTLLAMNRKRFGLRKELKQEEVEKLNEEDMKEEGKALEK